MVEELTGRELPAAGEPSRPLSPLRMAGYGLLGVGLLLLAHRLLRAGRAELDRLRLEEAIGNLDVHNSQQTISDTEARLYAERLYQAMDGVGTDTESIHSIFEEGLRTRADLVQVIRRFGVRPYGMTGANSSWIAQKIGWSTSLDLGGWLKRELGGSDLRRVEAAYRRMGMKL